MGAKTYNEMKSLMKSRPTVWGAGEMYLRFHLQVATQAESHFKPLIGFNLAYGGSMDARKTRIQFPPTVHQATDRNISRSQSH